MDNLESSVVYKDKQLVKAGQEIESLRRDKDQLYKQMLFSMLVFPLFTSFFIKY